MTRLAATRHCEEQSDVAIQSCFAQRSGLLRYARNDEAVEMLGVEI